MIVDFLDDWDLVSGVTTGNKRKNNMETKQRWNEHLKVRLRGLLLWKNKRVGSDGTLVCSCVAEVQDAHVVLLRNHQWAADRLERRGL
jgi:hypothetical protein